MDSRTLLYGALPQRLLSRCGGWMARRRWGVITTLFIRWFAGHYSVDLHEARRPDPAAYHSFADFFARALRDGARDWPADPGAVASPVDGVASLAGEIRAGTLVQAKHIDYSLEALLGGDPAAYRDGHFATLYLRPQDYHRVHVPVAGRLTAIRHLPGRLWPVRPWAVAGVPGLFARNERVVLEFTGAAGPWALVMVGALMVGSVETVVTGPIRGNRGAPARWNLEAADCTFQRGDEVGRFNFGSTVVLVFGPDQVEWDGEALAAGQTVRLGQSLGRLSR